MEHNDHMLVNVSGPSVNTNKCTKPGGHGELEASHPPTRTAGLWEHRDLNGGWEEHCAERAGIHLSSGNAIPTVEEHRVSLTQQ